MFDTHEGLSKLYEVSCAELDYLVAEARKLSSVIGARMMGGGFGGCTINIVKEDGIEEFIHTLSANYQQEFKITPEAYIVATGDGTREITAA